MIIRTEEDWQTALAAANSALEAADVYGPAPGEPYVAKGANPAESLVFLRNFLQRAWIDFDYNDIPECVACLDRILNDLSH